MDLTVQELAALVGGQFASNASAAAKITGAAAIADAGPGDITFFGNAKYIAVLKTCRATAALVPADFSEDVPPVAIRVANPSLAFAQVLAKLAPPPVVFAPGIHPSAVVADGAEIGEGAIIQACAVIEPGVKIGARSVIGAGSYVGHDARLGADCHLAARVTVGTRCLIGDRVIIHSGVVVGSDGFGFELSGGHHAKIPQTGIVQIDDDVEIGANTTIDRARFGRTWIGAGTKIDNLVQIAHNVVIGRHCILCALVGVSGSTRLGNYVVLGGQVGTVGHIEIGDGAQVAAQSGVSKDLPPKQVFFGTPAQPMREAKAQLARIGQLGKFYERLRQLENRSGASGKSSPPAT